MKCDLFDELLLSVLMYGGEVWGFYPAKAIEQVHKDFCKTAFTVKRTTMNKMIYGELGRVPLMVLRFCRIIEYWIKNLHQYYIV